MQLFCHSPGPKTSAVVLLSLHLHHRIGFRAERSQSSAVDGSGIDQHDLAMTTHIQTRGMGYHHASEAAVVALPERLTDLQIWAIVAVETSMGRHPACAMKDQRKALQTLHPLQGDLWCRRPECALERWILT